MNRIVPFVFLIVIAGFHSSCGLLKKKRGKKQAKIAADSTVTKAADTLIAQLPTDPAPLPIDTAELLREKANAASLGTAAAMWSKRLDYRTFSGKAKVHVETPDAGNDFAIHFRIRKDSVIWAGVNLAGIPVARVFVTRDSIFMIDYYHKEAKCVPLDSIAKILPTTVSFASLQNLIVGEPLCDGNLLEASVSADSVTMHVADESYKQLLVYSTADSTLKNELLGTTKPNGPVAKSFYGSYEAMGNRKLATERAVHVENNGVSYLLEMNFTKWEFDEPLDYPFSIPKSYRKE